MGDVVDAAFRANTRNAVVLEKHLREKGKKELRRSGLPIPDADPSSGNEYDRAPPYDAEPSSSHTAGAGSSQNGHGHLEPQQPQETRVHGNGGWLARNKIRPGDVEMGNGGNESAQNKKSKKSGRK